MADIFIIANGYSKKIPDGMKANCTCTLIKGKDNIVVDTMTPWDGKEILDALTQHSLKADDISYVISTHGHSDHTGNNNLFQSATHIVGFSISKKDMYFVHPFNEGKEYIINDDVKVVPTPGHTLSDVSVLVKTNERESVAITGDLFEREEDIENPYLWRETAGSEDPELQRKNRFRIASMADWIIPGHGPLFKVTEQIKKILQKQAE